EAGDGRRWKGLAAVSSAKSKKQGFHAKLHVYIQWSTKELDPYASHVKAISNQ
ncbi:hypothetical protein Dimus_003899, partial [Dionaea muscipula]